ncbi:membrane protein, partial [Acinetobacter sp. V2]
MRKLFITCLMGMA